MKPLHSRASGTGSSLAEPLEASDITKEYSILNQAGSEIGKTKQPASDVKTMKMLLSKVLL